MANKIGISNDFLSPNLAYELKQNLIQLNKLEQLKEAGIGNIDNLIQDKLFRNDKIQWLNRDSNIESEKSFFLLMDNFITFLNETCYTGITDYEFHYTRYAIGSFYKKHLDQFKNNTSRKYSMIMYLNEHWIHEDGGELLIHASEGNQYISPQQGKTVFFQSNELEHEVLITNKERLSVTGWLKVG